MFADSARIIIKSGKGGDGHVSFRREKFIPKGGPDGGDGGRGGNVIAIGDTNINTLLDYRYKRLIKAENGKGGSGARCRTYPYQSCGVFGKGDCEISCGIQI